MRYLPAATLGLVALVVSAFGACRAIYADDSDEAAARGTIELDTPELKLKLVRASQTAAAFEPKATPGFDFTPADQLEARSGDGF